MGGAQFQVVRCEMQGVEAVAADTCHAFGRHTHDRYGIGVMLRGAQKSLSGRGIVEARAGDIITVNPAEVHDGAPMDDKGRAWRMLYFEPAALADMIEDVTVGATRCAELMHPALCDPGCAARFVSLFRALTQSRGAYSDLEANEHLVVILGRLIARGTRGRSRAVPAGVERARTRIDDAPAQPMSLHELAQLSGVSQFQLVRAFSKATGLTPHAYVVQRRLQMTRRLIAAGMGLADAAQASGFADQSHMTRLFGRAYGVSPGRYAAAMN